MTPRLKSVALMLGAVSGLFPSGGCAASGETARLARPPVMTARYARTPIKVDGLPDEAAWKKAKAYGLSLDRANTEAGEVLVEPGEVRLAWDEKYLYLAVKFHDSDIVAEGERDQLDQYKAGDTAELFLKPEDRTWYWELHVTPAGGKTSFWYPGRGRLGLPSCREYACGLRAAAHCAGTLNNWLDTDRYWTAEMAMPVKDLTARGEHFGPGARWRILVGRYNYGRGLPKKELSMVPRLSKTWFHFYEEFAALELVK